MNTETQRVDVLAVMAYAVATYKRLNREARSSEDYRLDIEDAESALAAVADLIEAASLRVDYVNRSWYVQHPSGAAWSNVGHGSEREARAEADEALRTALARVGGAA
ncbi:hypothetical protein [Luteibacter yeojuensis]|uniref:Uncharacterized protein n=1 Tax=Luteibacter yeojuensis TaxID=345309 RepID=A0A7X5TPF6_9GAMM|nr:hypothetical protein [Luteibacter yeojuensis]NID15421.1 hypothetical protein [Luteibacter yeojuensis]